MTEHKSTMIFESTYWKIQRYLSILLIFFILWLSIIYLSFVSNTVCQDLTFIQMIQLIVYSDKNYMLILFSFIIFSHIGLGAVEIIEDYISNEQMKLISNILLKILIIRLMNEIYIFYIG